MSRLKKLREMRQMTLEELGDACGTSASQISKLELGKVNLTESWIYRLTTALGVRPSELLEDVPSDAAGSLRESDAEPFTLTDAPELARLQSGEQFLWRATTNALDEIGIRAGDVVLVDISTTALDDLRTGDPVIAQDASQSNAGARTVLRQFIEPDLLITNSATENELPLNRKLHDVAIVGRVINHIRNTRRR